METTAARGIGGATPRAAADRPTVPAPSADVIERIVAAALAEDVGWGDITTHALVSDDLTASAAVIYKQPAVVAGLPVLVAAFRLLDPACRVDLAVAEGACVTAPSSVATVHGRASALLTAERVALNFLQRLSAIATLTAQFAAAIEGTSATIVDTRKTTPGLRVLEKYAVRVGGGQNHRFNLADGVLIKDNHLAALRSTGRGLADGVRLARLAAPHTLKIEVETETLDHVREAVAAGADIILLDNMSVAQMRMAVEIVAGRAVTEASGGVRLDTIRGIAETGVDLISIGALTHSAPAIDISLEFSLMTEGAR